MIFVQFALLIRPIKWLPSVSCPQRRMILYNYRRIVPITSNIVYKSYQLGNFLGRYGKLNGHKNHSLAFIILELMAFWFFILHFHLNIASKLKELPTWNCTDEMWGTRHLTFAIIILELLASVSTPFEGGEILGVSDVRLFLSRMSKDYYNKHIVSTLKSFWTPLSPDCI